MTRPSDCMRDPGHSRLAGDLRSALETVWPDVTFTLEAASSVINVYWVDGPGRRAVLNELRMAGAGTRRIVARRTLTPTAQFAMILCGVKAVDAPNIDAPNLGEPIPLLARILPAKWSDAARMLAAFAELAPDELEIATVLASEDPDVDPLHIAAMARALAKPDAGSR